MGRIDWSQVLSEIDDALRYFESEGVKPTLRTIFYYLVSKQVIPNTRSSYKRLSRVLVEARKRGRYRWDFLEDKTRVVLGYLGDSCFSESSLERFKERLEAKLEELDIDKMLSEFFDWLKPSFSFGKWANQPVVCEIWIEKEALAETIHNWVCGLSIPIRVNRGYSSWTFIYNNVQTLRYILDRHEKVVVFYLGDLDPSGVDIERFLREALQYFGLNSDRVELKRLAVTPEQVEKFNLPPRPEDSETLEKLARDPRTKSYKIPYIVELDSLVAYAPREFKEIVRNAVNELWDKSIYEKLRERAKELEMRANEMLEEVKKRAKQKIIEMIKGE